MKKGLMLYFVREKNGGQLNVNLQNIPIILSDRIRLTEDQ